MNELALEVEELMFKNLILNRIYTKVKWEPTRERIVALSNNYLARMEELLNVDDKVAEIGSKIYLPEARQKELIQEVFNQVGVYGIELGTIKEERKEMMA